MFKDVVFLNLFIVVNRNLSIVSYCTKEKGGKKSDCRFQTATCVFGFSGIFDGEKYCPKLMRK